MSEKNNSSSSVKANGLSRRQLWWYGFSGGIISALVTNGAFEVTVIEKIIGESNMRYFQLGVIVIVGIITATIAGFWVMLHRPIHTALIAVQLGLIAPTAILSTLKSAGADYVEKNTRIEVIAPANAMSLGKEKTKKPTIFDCIVKSIVLQVC